MSRKQSIQIAVCSGLHEKAYFVWQVLLSCELKPSADCNSEMLSHYESLDKLKGFGATKPQKLLIRIHSLKFTALC